MTAPEHGGCEPHDEAEALLPWYATGQLDEPDRVRLEVHLSSCSHCREQLSLERRLVREFRAMTPEVESGWSRLRARIDGQVIARRNRTSAIEHLRGLLTRPALAGLVTAQFAFVAVAAGVLITLTRPVYHTLGSAPSPDSANVIVMFRPEARVRDVDDTLRAAGASIVEGPTDANAYLLHVDPRKRDSALQRLRSGGKVQLAQPIDGVAP